MDIPWGRYYNERHQIRNLVASVWELERREKQAAARQDQLKQNLLKMKEGALEERRRQWRVKNHDDCICGEEYKSCENYNSRVPRLSGMYCKNPKTGKYKSNTPDNCCVSYFEDSEIDALLKNDEDKVEAEIAAAAEEVAKAASDRVARLTAIAKMKAALADKMDKAAFVDGILDIEMQQLQESGEYKGWWRRRREAELYEKNLNDLKRLNRELIDNARRERDLSQLSQERRVAAEERARETAEYEADKRAKRKADREWLESLSPEERAEEEQRRQAAKRRLGGKLKRNKKRTNKRNKKLTNKRNKKLTNKRNKKLTNKRNKKRTNKRKSSLNIEDQKYFNI